MDRFLKIKEVMDIVKLSRSSIYQYRSEGIFPAPIKIGKRAVAFRESDITAWIEQRLRSHYELINGKLK